MLNGRVLCFTMDELDENILKICFLYDRCKKHFFQLSHKTKTFIKLKLKQIFKHFQKVSCLKNCALFDGTMYNNAQQHVL